MKVTSKKVLTKWRKEALAQHNFLDGWDNDSEFTRERRMLCERVLTLTQELLDMHLIKEISNANT